MAKGEATERKRPRSAPAFGRRIVVCATALLLVMLAVPSAHAFLSPASTSLRSTRLHMIGNVFGGGNDNKDPQLPKDVKDAISKCRGAVQKGLEDRISRMIVDMPVGANFGVENKKASRNKRGNLSSLTGDDKEQEEGLTLEKLDTSDRELARLFVEMFQPLGGDHIAAVFNDEYLAGQARQLWNGDLAAECKVCAIDRKMKKSALGKQAYQKAMGMGGKKKKKKAKGFAAKMAEEMEDEGSSSGPFNLPKDTEVALFVSPGPKELVAIERICDKAGPGTCIILLNARLPLIEKYASEDACKLFTEEFLPVWSLTAAPQEEAPGCLMHRAYPGPWILARKPKVGPPKTIAEKDGAKFTEEECKEAYESIEVTDLEKGRDMLAENFAGWFK